MYIIQQMFLVRNFNLTVIRTVLAFSLSSRERLVTADLRLDTYFSHRSTVILPRLKEIPWVKMAKMTIAKALIGLTSFSQLAFVFRFSS